MAVVLLSCVLLAACADDDASRLVVEGQKIVFNVGDEFTTGDDFRVYLESNGKRTDVTADAEVKPEKGLNMNVADEYAVTVSYGKKKEVYYIIVNDSNPTLTKLSVDASEAVTEFKVGESISYDGLKLIGTYRNAQNKLYDDVITAWNTYRFEITSQYGAAYEDLFVSEGEYTVKISRGELAATYTVTVAGANYESVKSGIGLGKYFKKNVVSGSYTEKSLGFVSLSYTFGDNYTFIQKNDAGTIDQYHVSIVNGKADITYLYDGGKVPPPLLTSELIDGPCIKPWYFDDNMSSYGIEDLISDLYDIGIKNPNYDYVETVDSQAKTFEFTFGRLNNLNGPDRHYFWETSVRFTLGDSNFIESATVVQKTWFIYPVIGADGKQVLDDDGAPLYNFTKDKDTGVVTPNDEVNFTWSVTCSQVVGTRTAKNPYLSEEGKKGSVQDYKIFLLGKEIKNGDVVEIEQGNRNENGHFRQYTLEIRELFPEGSSFDGDPLYVTDGTMNKEDSANWFYGLNFQLIGSWNNYNKTIEPQRGGLYYLEFTSKHTTKKIWFNVTGANPTKLTPQVYNPANKVVSSSSDKSVGISETVYFSCIPDAYTNGAFTAALTSGDSTKAELLAPDSNATPDEIASDPTLKYWRFKASETGTYVITMTSSVAPAVKTTLTVTVKTIDYAAILNGNYSAEDSAHGVYTVKFTPDGEGLATGRVEISYDKDSTSVVYEYSIVSGKIELSDPVSGDDLGVSFSVDDNDRLILTDKYGNNYVAVKES